MSKKLTIEEFIRRSRIIHGDKYDYSLSEYKNLSSKIIIICSKHGIFKQFANAHLQGSGCRKCVNENQALTKEQFIRKANLKHNNKYNYSKVEYVNMSEKVCIICPEHGEFWQEAGSHIQRNGCILCRNQTISKNQTFSIEKFIEKANIAHKGKYNYSKTVYTGNRNRVKIICPIHGEFEQLAASHMKGYGCNKCNVSKGENAILEYLIDKNISFVKEKIFDNFVSSSKSFYKFDFYLPTYNLCIEFDGLQHFKPFSFGSDQSEETKLKNLENIKRRDSVKNQYCKDNNIDLLRIPYWKISNIKEILDNYIFNI